MIRTRSSNHGTNPTNHHPYANPADQFNLAFGAAAADQQAQQAPRDDINHDHDNDGSGDDGSANSKDSTANPTNNNSNAIDPGCAIDPGRRLAEFRENFNPENIRKSRMVQLCDALLLILQA